MRRLRAATALSLVALMVVSSAAGATGDARVAALQVALRARGLYNGDVDGLRGPETARAVRVLQARAKITVDGVVGPRTRKALGRLGRPRYGARTLTIGRRGWDVASLQFRLAEHGFPSGGFDGVFGPRTRAAVRRFQEWAGLRVDGHAGRATYRALRARPPSSPLTFAPPLAAPYTDEFGPRGARYHTGVDFPAPHGTPVFAARSGRVTVARWIDGYGYTIVIRHALDVTTMYAHLSAFAARDGQRVAPGQRVGRVGASGSASGPHLHFEVRVRGAAVDPLPTFR